MRLNNATTLSQEVEGGTRLFYANVLATLIAVLLSFILTIAYGGSYSKLMLLALIAAMVMVTVSLLAGLARLNIPKTKATYVLDARIYVNLKEGLVLPSPSPLYLLQFYAHQLYRLLDRCNLADKNAVRRPPDSAELYGSKLDFITELFEEALLRIIASCSHECLRYYGGRVVDIDLAATVKPRLTAILNEVKDRCGIEGADTALLRIPMLIPSDFSISVRRVGKPNNLLEIAIRGKYCSLRIGVVSYAWSSQVVIRTGPIPMLDEMPILSTTVDHYTELSKIDIDASKTSSASVLVTEGIVSKYCYHVIVEMEYSRLFAILSSERTASCLRYLECLVERLKSYADWSYRAELDYNKIREEEILSTIKRVEANLGNLRELLESSLYRERHGD